MWTYKFGSFEEFCRARDIARRVLGVPRVALECRPGPKMAWFELVIHQEVWPRSSADRAAPS